MVSRIETRDGWLPVEELVACREGWSSVDGVTGHGSDFEQLGGEEEEC